MSPVRPAASCHSEGAQIAGAPDVPVVALVGNPNVGKSTLFNLLTGSRRDMGNWPGTTVAVGRDLWQLPASGRETEAELSQAVLVDLPGAVSLHPKSPDEALTRELLLHEDVDQRPNAVVVVLSAVSLTRGLYLLHQVLDQNLPTLIALSHVDIAARRGITVDAEALAASVGIPVIPVHPRGGTGSAELVQAVRQMIASPQVHAAAATPLPRAATTPDEDPLAAAGQIFDWVAEISAAAVQQSATGRMSFSDRLDRIVLSPALGPLAFLAVMWAVFQATTTLAAPLQDALDGLFSGPITSATQWVLATLGLGDTWIEALLVNGLIAGVGMLLTFIPVMAIMFAALHLLEDSGYMARAAVVADRLMRRIGLPGRAFLPLIVGFGCNVPAISATRILSDSRHRLLTVLLVPLTSCSARLTVYVLVATTFFGSRAGTVVFGMYLLSIVLVVGLGFVLRRTVVQTMGAEELIVELPAYQRPSLRLMVRSAWQRLQGFLRTASGIIVMTVVVVWALGATPGVGQSGGFNDVPVQDSLYAQASGAVAPIFEPAGFGTWESASALVVGFVAKEAVVASWAQTYATAEPASEREPGSLGEALKENFDASSGGHPLPAVFAFLVFLLAYTPCVATLAAQRREVGLRWTLFGVAIQFAMAWGLAVATFQVGSRLW